MTESTGSPFSYTHPERDGSRRAVSLLGAAVLLGVMGVLAPDRLLQMGLLAASLAVMSLGFVITLRDRNSRSRHESTVSTIAAFIEKDASPSFVCSADGEVLQANAAARQTYATRKGETMAGTLRNTFANPGGILFRLKKQAEIDGAAREDIVTRKGHMRLAVHEMDGETLLWRLEAAPDTGQGPRCGWSRFADAYGRTHGCGTLYE